MISRIVFYPSLVFNIAMEKLSSRNWYDRIDDTVLLGALPFRSMTKQLVEEEKVTGVITMNEEYETRYLVNSKEEWAKVGVENLRLSVPDLVAAPSSEQMEEGVEFILAHKRRGGCVYVHCKAGRTRSTTIVAAYLMKLHGWNAENSVEYIQAKRPHIWLRDKQWKALSLYSQSLGNKYRSSS